MPFKVNEWKPIPVEIHPREDIRLKAHAEKLGFEASVDEQGFWIEGIPYNAYRFAKGKTLIWYIGPQRTSIHIPQTGDWIAADLGKDNVYRNHRTYEDLKTALEAEKK